MSTDLSNLVQYPVNHQREKWIKPSFVNSAKNIYLEGKRNVGPSPSHLFFTLWLPLKCSIFSAVLLSSWRFSVMFSHFFLLYIYFKLMKQYVTRCHVQIKLAVKQKREKKITHKMAAVWTKVCECVSVSDRNRTSATGPILEQKTRRLSYTEKKGSTKKKDPKACGWNQVHKKTAR